MFSGISNWCFMVNASGLHFETEEDLGLKEIQLLSLWELVLRL